MQVAFVDATFHFKHSVISYSEPILRKRKSPIYAYVFCVNLRTVVSDVWNFYFSTRENALKKLITVGDKRHCSEMKQSRFIQRYSQQLQYASNATIPDDYQQTAMLLKSTWRCKRCWSYLTTLARDTVTSISTEPRHYSLSTKTVRILLALRLHGGQVCQ